MPYQPYQAPAQDPKTVNQMYEYEPGYYMPNPYYGMPTAPDFRSLLDEQGNLPDNFMVHAPGTSPAEEELRRRSMTSPGDSPWARYQLAQSKMDEARGLGDAGGQVSADMAQARSNLAMRGGATSGARERIAEQGMRDRLLATQGVRGNAAAERMNIRGQDAQNSNQLLQALNSTEQARDQSNLQAQEFNTGNQYNEKRAEDLYLTNQYNQAMKAWGANRQADATENSGKK